MRFSAGERKCKRRRLLPDQTVIGRFAATRAEANAIWFIRPDGFYYSAEKGFTGLSLSARADFPALMAGPSVLSAAVISLSTGKRSVVIAEPVRIADQSTGGYGISYSVDRLSREISEAMQLSPAVVFYALDINSQTTLHRDPTLMFESRGLRQL